MSRWRSSLAVLAHASSIEAQFQGAHPIFRRDTAALHASAVPDFLAPSCHRRHNTSYTRALFGQTPSDASESSTRTNTASSLSSSSSSSSSTLTTQATKRVDHAQVARPSRSNAASIDFQGYFDADVPAENTLSSSTTPLDYSKAMAEQMHAATDEGELAKLARAIYYSSAVQAERQTVARMLRAADPPALRNASALHLNESFILSLADASRVVTRHRGRKDPLLMDQLVAKYLRITCRALPNTAFSDSFLVRLARRVSKAGPLSVNAVSYLLFGIVKDCLSHQQAEPQARTIHVASNMSSSLYQDRAQNVSQILLDLMTGFLRSGRFEAVKTCFDLLKEHSLPVTVFHHQLKLVALFRERTNSVERKGQTDLERETQELYSQILQTQASMKANNIVLDDTFLATVLHGLGAPLRGPLATVASISQAQNALEMVRVVFRKFSAMHRSADLGSKPRLLSSFINVELDAVKRAHGLTTSARAKTVERIQHMMRPLEWESTRTNSPIVACLRGKAFTEAQLTSVYLKIRLQAILGEVGRGMDLLQELLSLEPSDQPDAAKQWQEVVLKQRSSVVSLFSSAMQQRASVDRQNTAFEVLRMAFSPIWFDRVWTDVGLKPDLALACEMDVEEHDEEHDADEMVLRLWKRWMHAWSTDRLAEGSVVRGVDSSMHAHGKPVRYRTFTGSYPWQTLKQGLGLLNQVVDQYEAMDAKRAVDKVAAGGMHQDALAQADLDVKPASRIAHLSQLFTDRGVLDRIVKFCVRGGRPARGETLRMYVGARLHLLVNTLTRVRVNARTWEHVESSMLRHLALIPSDVLPTSDVAPTMDVIQERKARALLRIPELRTALQNAHHPPSTLPPETGSIFILRHMLNQHERAKRPHQLDATQPKPAFT